MNINFDKIHEYKLLYPLWAALLAFIYFFSLHPKSGALGGMVLVITGWTIPTVIVALLSWFIAQLLSRKLYARVIFAVLISMALGLNTKLFILNKAFHKPTVQMEIVDPIEVSNGVKINRNGFEEINRTE